MLASEFPELLPAFFEDDLRHAEKGIAAAAQMLLNRTTFFAFILASPVLNLRMFLCDSEPDQKTLGICVSPILKDGERKSRPPSLMERPQALTDLQPREMH